jgi:hypothetical protein
VKRLALTAAARSRAAQRVVTGTAIVYRRRADALAAWVAAGRRDDLTGWRAALGPLLRLAMLAAAAYIVWAILARAAWLMWLLTALWLRAAWRAGRGRAEEPDSAPEEDEPAPPDDVYEATLEWVRGQVADRNGVHLSDLLDHAHAHGLFTDLDVPGFRAALERWGFPVRQQLKVAGRNRPGIHRDDLPQEAPVEGSPLHREDTTTAA